MQSIFQWAGSSVQRLSLRLLGGGGGSSSKEAQTAQVPGLHTSAAGEARMQTTACLLDAYLSRLHSYSNARAWLIHTVHCSP